MHFHHLSRNRHQVPARLEQDAKGMLRGIFPIHLAVDVHCGSFHSEQSSSQQHGDESVWLYILRSCLCSRPQATLIVQDSAMSSGSLKDFMGVWSALFVMLWNAFVECTNPL
jgi:hypothetical protein